MMSGSYWSCTNAAPIALHAGKNFVSLQDATTERSLIAPELGGWLPLRAADALASWTPSTSRKR